MSSTPLKCWLMPIFFPIIPLLISYPFTRETDAILTEFPGLLRLVSERLQLYLYINAGGKIKLHERIHRLWSRIQNVHQPLMRPDFKLLPGLLVNMGRTEHRPAVDPRR